MHKMAKNGDQRGSQSKDDIFAAVSNWLDHQVAIPAELTTEIELL